jgi:hypothetical protein
MQLKFKKIKKITGIYPSCLLNETPLLDEIDNYNFSENSKLGKIMGYGTQRIVVDKSTKKFLIYAYTE